MQSLKHCLGWWRKDPLVVLLPAAAGTGCKLFLHLSQEFSMYLEQMWCPGALSLSSLCSTGPAVSPVTQVCVCCTQIPARDQGLVKNNSCGGWLQRGELVRVILLGFVHFLLNENNWHGCNHWFEITGELEDVKTIGIFTPECFRQSFQKSVLQGQ